MPEQNPVEVTVRRVPRYGVLMVLGMAVGVLAAAIVTAAGSYEPSQALSVVYPPGQVFGFTLLWTVPLGLALGGTVGLIMERVARRHNRRVQATRETITIAEEDSIFVKEYDDEVYDDETHADEEERPGCEERS